MKIYVAIIACAIIFTKGTSQVPFSYEFREKHFNDGYYFSDLALHGLASYSFRKYMESARYPAEGFYQKLWNESLFQSEIGDLFLELPQAPNRLHYSIDNHLPDPITIPAILELGGYNYNQRFYKNCVEIYNKMDLSVLPEKDQVEPRFRKGYCHFVMKEFSNAKTEFSLIKKDLGDYYFHTQYYLGLCEYFTGNLENAVNYFRAAEQSVTYKTYIPYYICQILRVQGKTTELLTYGEQSLNIPGVKNAAQIRLLLAQSYFSQSDYNKALPHFEYYAGQNATMSVEEFYQIAFTNYQVKNYAKAIQYFQSIQLENNKFGQLANYYLADSYLKTGEKNEARFAFKKVSQMNFIPAMQDEAAFNFAKLTAILGIEREAINALNDIPENSKYYNESREILADILEKSSDLYHVLQVLEKQKKMTPRFSLIYQSKQIQAGHKAYLDKNWTTAEQHYSKSLQYTESKEAEAEALYWKAQSEQNMKNFDASILTFEKFFSKSKNLNLPMEYSPFMANYGQGYNHLKKLNYKKAFEYYQNAGQIYQRNGLNTNPWKAIAADATARAGDCAFKDRNYATALKQYQLIIDKKWDNSDYAMYQKGLLLGLQNEPYEKIVVLKELTTKFKESTLLDLAYMQIGDTYGDLNSQDNAYKAYQDLIRQFAKSSSLVNEARIKCGLIAYNKGDLNAAIKHYREVLQSNPTPQEVQSAITGLEEIYINDLGKPDEYLAILDKIPGYKPSTYSTDSLNYKVGEVRFLNGDYEKATDAFTVYLTKFPKGYYIVQAYYYRAESNAVLKKYPEALKDYDACVQLGNSAFLESALKKAALITFNFTSEFQKAYQYYHQYYNTTPVNAEKLWAANGAMKSAFKNNQLTETVNYTDIILQNPLANKEDKAVAAYHAGKLNYTQKKYNEAMSYFQKIEKDVNTSQAAEARFWIGDILIKNEKWNEAEVHCNEINELNKYYPYWIARSVLLLADIYLHKNDLFSARAAIEAVLENFSDDEGLIKLANAKKIILEEKEKTNSKIKPKSQNQLMLDNRPKN